MTSSVVSDGAVPLQPCTSIRLMHIPNLPLNKTEESSTKSVCCRTVFKCSFSINCSRSLQSVTQLPMGSVDTGGKQCSSRVQCDSDTSRVQCDSDPSRVQCDSDPSRVQCDSDTSRVQCDSDTSRVQCDSDTSRVQCDSDTSRVQCDGSVPVKLDRVRRGGSYVEMLRNGDLDLAYPSRAHCHSSQPYDLCRTRYRDAPQGGGEIVYLQSKLYSKRFLTAHTSPEPGQEEVDGRATIDPGSQYPRPDSGSLWRSLSYEDAFSGTKYYQPDLVGHRYIVLQHWSPGHTDPTDYKSGRYFVIVHDIHRQKWIYTLGSLQTSFSCGLFQFA